MRRFVLPLLGALLLTGCAAAGGNGPKDAPASGQAAVQAASSAENAAQPGSDAGKGDMFNPYVHDRLPNTRTMTAEGQSMLKQLGGREQRIEAEAAHRPHWKQELYPVIFGDPKAPHEIVVLLDFASPQSEKVWQAVADAAKSLKPSQCKIVVFADSKETYGTDLMGLAIWTAYSRPGQAMQYLSYALSRWNAVKAEQKKKGRVKPFTNEYDAVAAPEDYPIHYGYLQKLNPPVPAEQELAVARYCYDAGNVNMYQAVQIRNYYGIKQLPAVVVDGKVLASVSTQAVLNALK